MGRKRVIEESDESAYSDDAQAASEVTQEAPKTKLTLRFSGRTQEHAAPAGGPEGEPVRLSGGAESRPCGSWCSFTEVCSLRLIYAFSTSLPNRQQQGHLKGESREATRLQRSGRSQPASCSSLEPLADGRRPSLCFCIPAFLAVFNIGAHARNRRS